MLLFHKESRSKKNYYYFFLGGGGVQGAGRGRARVSEFFFTKNLNIKKKFRKGDYSK